MSEPLMHCCHTCGYQWMAGQSGAHNCATRLDEQRLKLCNDLAAMQRRAEAAEKREQERKQEADIHRGNLNAYKELRDRDNDAHAKDYEELLVQRDRLMTEVAELTRQRDRLSKTLDSLGFSGKLFAGGGEQESGIDTAGPMTPDQPCVGKPDPEAQLAAYERENDRLRLVIDGIQNLLSLAE